MKVGELKNILNKLDKNKKVVFDFCDCIPTTIDSWRGIYAEPALGWKIHGYADTPTVDQLLTELNIATNGKPYGGWKGGLYAFNDDSKLHVDNPGRCSYTEISGVDHEGYLVVLLTCYKNYH